MNYDRGKAHLGRHLLKTRLEIAPLSFQIHNVKIAQFRLQRLDLPRERCDLLAFLPQLQVIVEFSLPDLEKNDPS